MVFLLVLLVCDVCANSINSVAIEPTFECAGIIITLGGTDDPGAVTLEVKGPTDSVYKLAHPFTRFDNRHMASSLFNLNPGTNYSIRSTLGGISTISVFTTRTEFVLPAPLSVVNVNTIAGLRTAISTATAGTHIVVAAGTYTGVFTVSGRTGTAANPIVIRGNIPQSEKEKAVELRTGLPVFALNGGVDVLNSSYIVFDSLRFENPVFGAGPAIHVVSPSTNFVLEDCQIVVTSGAWTHHTVYIEGDGGTTKIGRHLIQNNYIYDNGLGTGYSISLSNYAPCGSVIRGNLIIGPRDGINPVGNEIDNTLTEVYDDVLAKWPNHSTDIYDNTIYTSDDNIECDGIGVNIRIFRNNLLGRQGGDGRSTSGISIAPVLPGPIFFIRNVMTKFRQGAIKYNTAADRGLTRNCFFYHNTIYDKGTPSLTLTTVWGTAPDNNPSKNTYYKNNIFYGDQKLVERTGTAHVVSYNPNFWYSTRTSGTMFQWDSADYLTFSSWKAGSGQETNGYWGDPLLDTSTFNLNIGSPAIDKGILIPGINDSYVGSAPDMGAFEYGTSTTTTTNTGSGADVFANLKVYPNPFKLGTNTSIKIVGLPSDTTLKLYSADGGLLRTLSEVDYGNYGWVTWDGKNTEGTDVAFGVYVCVAEDGKGNKKTGKIAVTK